MGHRIDHTEGPVVCGSTTKALYYFHPADARMQASKIGCITAEIKTGTRTGWCRIYAGWPGTDRCLMDGPLTAGNPRLICMPEIVLEPGQMISAFFTNVTATDTVFFSVEGH